MRGTGISNAIMGIGKAYGFEPCHALQVTRLAQRLLDGLQSLHGMGNTEKIWLHAAAMLHDIGKARDPKDHHKLAQEIIVHADELPFRPEERVIIGLVARYHRGALPRDEHKYFQDLNADSRHCVCKLAALLRLADGLDKGHCGLVEDLRCEIGRRQVLIQLVSSSLPDLESALNKADLLCTVFRKEVVLRVPLARRNSGSALDLDAGLTYADSN